MLIEYTKPNVLNLPLTGKDGVSEGHVMIVPGINEVPKTSWGRCAELPKVKRLIDAKELTVILANDDTDEVFAISTVEVKEAVKVVKKTWNIILLEDWLAGESRSGVTKAINAQIKLVQEKTTPRKAASNE